MERELGQEVIGISAVTGQGLALLVGRVAELLKLNASALTIDN
jgi:hypothetical protein